MEELTYDGDEDDGHDGDDGGDDDGDDGEDLIEEELTYNEVGWRKGPPQGATVEQLCDEDDDDDNLCIDDNRGGAKKVYIR